MIAAPFPLSAPPFPNAIINYIPVILGKVKLSMVVRFRTANAPARMSMWVGIKKAHDATNFAQVGRHRKQICR